MGVPYFILLFHTKKKVTLITNVLLRKYQTGKQQTLSHLGYPQGAADVHPTLLSPLPFALGFLHRAACVLGHLAQLARRNSRVLERDSWGVHKRRGKRGFRDFATLFSDRLGGPS